MLDWISVLINVLLLLVTLGTVVFASKTLLMEYSSQVTVSRYKFSSNIDKYYPYYWEVGLMNVGKGYIVKAFILLSVPSKKYKFLKYYFLSKPAVGLNPGENSKLILTLNDEHLKNTNADLNTIKLEVLYQDSLNNIYVVSPGLNEGNKHLESFDELPRRMRKYWLKYWIYNMKIKKAIKQCNTYPKRFFSELQSRQKELENCLNIEQINDKDTK